MTTLIDWNALYHKVQSYSGESPYCSTPSKCFTYLALEYLLSLAPDEIEDAITDGPNDRGIDAIYVDERDGRNVIHLFQFKHVASFQKAKNNFPSKEIDKLLSFCADLLSQVTDMQETCNPILWTKVQEIWQALKNPSPCFEVHFCGNMAGLVDTQARRVDAALASYRSFTVNHHTLDSLVDLFITKKRPKINAQLTVVDKNYFERSDGNIRGLIVTLEASQIVNLITDPTDPSQVRHCIFNDNVRVYLTKKNRINKKIYATALSDKNAEFWYLNNGITMTCDSFSYQPAARAPVVSLKNVQIVNGGQTSNALFEASKEQAEKLHDVLVLTRIYETKDLDITTDIAEATNSQTPINTRDLRSNDDVQKKLEEAFLDQEFYYERKAKQHQGQPRQKRIDAMSAGQVFLAYFLGLPEVAKKDRARVFGDLYDNVFNDDITTQKLLVPLSLFSEIESHKRAIQRHIKRQEPFDADLLYLIDGAYHVLFTIYQLCESIGIDPLDETQAKAQLTEAIELLKRIVRDESARDEAFTASRFFKDAKTKMKIQKAVVESRSARTTASKPH